MKKLILGYSLAFLAFALLFTNKGFSQSDSSRAQSHFDTGIALQQSSKWGDSIKQFQDAIQIDPSFGDAYVNLAYSYNRLNQYPEAISAATRALSLNADSKSALKERAEAYLKLKQFDRALADLNRAIGLDPDEPYIRNLHAQVLEKLGRKKEAQAEVAELHAASSDNFQDCYSKAQALYEAYDYKGAIPLLTRAYQLNDSVLAAIHDRGTAYARVGDFNQSVKDLTFCLEHDPSYERCFYHRGISELALRQYDKATQDFRKYLEVAKWDAENAHYAVLFCCITDRMQKRDKEATQLLTQALQNLPQKWPYPVIRYLAGKDTPERLLQQATDNDKKTEANAYIGLNLLAQGNPTQGTSYLQWVKQNGNISFDEYVIAKTELSRLANGK